MVRPTDSNIQSGAQNNSYGTGIRIMRRNTSRAPNLDIPPVVWPVGDEKYSLINSFVSGEREFINVVMMQDAYKERWKDVHRNQVQVILGVRRVFLNTVTVIQQ